MRITLRQASPEDFDYCASVYFAGMEKSIREFGLNVDDQAASLRRQWVVTEVRMILADGGTAGWLQCRIENDALFLAQFFVDAPFQRQGIGSMVLADLIQEAVALGRPVTLGVVQANPARRLYERFGFRVTHEDERKFYMRREATSQAPVSG